MGVNNVDFDSLTVSSTAVGLASGGLNSIPSGAKGAVITVETDQVRWRDDGTAPTASIGHLVNAGDVITFDSWSNHGNNWRAVLNAIRFIRVTSDATLRISYYD